MHDQQNIKTCQDYLCIPDSIRKGHLPNNIQNFYGLKNFTLIM